MINREKPPKQEKKEKPKSPFKINDYLELRLKDGKTVVYVGKGEDKKEFKHCKYLLMNIPDKPGVSEIESIDEAAAKYSGYHEVNKTKIDSKTEFWGHCSNLQVWAENNYDTRLLRSNLAFPLLKKLTEAGDPQAKRVFKEEIAKRMKSKTESVILMLIDEYLGSLDKSEREVAIRNALETKNYEVFEELVKRDFINDLSGFEDSLKDFSDSRIIGDLNLIGLKSAEGLKLPEKIGGYLYLDRLTSAEGLKLPEEIGGSLFLSDLASVEGLKLPEEIGKGLDLRNLTSAKGLKFPEEIGGDLKLWHLTSAEDLKLPEKIDGHLYLDRLTSAEGLKLPEEIGGDLDLRSLISAEGLKLPKEIGGDLELRSLVSPKGLKLPERIGGFIYLRGLKSAKGLKFPEEIGGGLDLRNLTSAEGLKLPKEIGGHLYLNKLTSIEGLKMPEKIAGLLFLKKELKGKINLPKSINVGYL